MTNRALAMPEYVAQLIRMPLARMKLEAGSPGVLRSKASVRTYNTIR